MKQEVNVPNTKSKQIPVKIDQTTECKCHQQAKSAWFLTLASRLKVVHILFIMLLLTYSFGYHVVTKCNAIYFPLQGCSDYGRNIDLLRKG